MHGQRKTVPSFAGTVLRRRESRIYSMEGFARAHSLTPGVVCTRVFAMVAAWLRAHGRLDAPLPLQPYCGCTACILLGRWLDDGAAAIVHFRIGD